MAHPCFCVHIGLATTTACPICDKNMNSTCTDISKGSDHVLYTYTPFHTFYREFREFYTHSMTMYFYTFLHSHTFIQSHCCVEICCFNPHFVFTHFLTISTFSTPPLFTPKSTQVGYSTFCPSCPPWLWLYCLQKKEILLHSIAASLSYKMVYHG